MLAEARSSAGESHRPGDEPDGLQRHAQAVSLGGEDRRGVQENVADRPALVSDTTTTAVQAKQQPKTSTILDVGGRSELGNTGAAEKSVSLSGGFSHRRPLRSKEALGIPSGWEMWKCHGG